MKTRALYLPKAICDTRVRTLVVDDSPFMLKILAQILQEAGNFDLVGTATDGAQALRYVSMLSPDLVLMDVHMQRVNGIEATRHIKKREHPPIVILVSSDESAVTNATAAGAEGFVIKQGNIRHRLIGTLQTIFGTRRATRASTEASAVPNPSRVTKKITAGLKSVKQKTNETSSTHFAVEAI